MADKIASRTGVDRTVILGALGNETGWGKSVTGRNNLGNIKSVDGAGTAGTDNMTGSSDRYQDFDSPDAFADAYAGLLNRRYAGALNSGPDAFRFGQALQSGGYAEDKDYAHKVTAATASVAKAIGARPGDPTTSSGGIISPANAATGSQPFDLSQLDDLPPARDASGIYDASGNRIGTQQAANPGSGFFGAVNNAAAHPVEAARGVASGASKFLDDASMAIGQGVSNLTGIQVDPAERASFQKYSDAERDFQNDPTVSPDVRAARGAGASVGAVLANPTTYLPIPGSSVAGRLAGGALVGGLQGSSGAAVDAYANGGSMLDAALQGGAYGALAGGALGGAGEIGSRAVNRLLAPAARPVIGGFDATVGNATRAATQDAVDRAAVWTMPADQRALAAIRAQTGDDFNQALAKSQFARDFQGPAAPPVRGGVDVPLSTAQQFGIPGVSILDKNFQNFSQQYRNVAANLKTAQQEAIRTNIGALGPDGAVAAAEKARAVAAQPFYDANANRLFALDQAGQDLISRPSARQALTRANSSLADAGVQVPPEATFRNGPNGSTVAPTALTGAQLQQIEQTLRLSSRGGPAVHPAEAADARSLMQTFKSFARDLSPDYAKAQEAFRQASPAVNDMRVAEALQNDARVVDQAGQPLPVTKTRFNTARGQAMKAADGFGVSPEMQTQLDRLQGQINRTEPFRTAAGSDTAENLQGARFLGRALGVPSSDTGFSLGAIGASAAHPIAAPVIAGVKAVAGEIAKGRSQAVQSIVQDVLTRPAALAELVESLATKPGKARAEALAAKASAEAISALGEAAASNPQAAQHLAQTISNASPAAQRAVSTRLSAKALAAIRPFLLAAGKVVPRAAGGLLAQGQAQQQSQPRQPAGLLGMMTGG
ncbi:glucosaminidase domain-containing protein [Caballeronia sp. LZ033]|uniref:glucosaminidase domain-containing protein n=1 Tax=Caballeronia sp. LZ033 TaxID=3038566 RepID=UPI00285E33D1|nr:glucosaminidase domain-containing protein [Caballeronia sp. LZ033]MDR5813053.1 glucosaminidase domain-containing protein [Caballeronia sp. LZ033]